MKTTILVCGLLLLGAGMTMASDSYGRERWATLAGIGDTLDLGTGETALLVFVEEPAVLTYERLNAEGATLASASFVIEGPGSFPEGNGRAKISMESPLPLVGPARVTLANDGSSAVEEDRVVGIRIVPTVEPDVQLIGRPSNAVVVLSDTDGSVRVVLEQSEDLVNWTEVQPGTFGASERRRFFRARAENVQQ